MLFKLGFLLSYTLVASWQHSGLV